MVRTAQIARQQPAVATGPRAAAAAGSKRKAESEADVEEKQVKKKKKVSEMTPRERVRAHEQRIRAAKREIERARAHASSDAPEKRFEFRMAPARRVLADMLGEGARVDREAAELLISHYACNIIANMILPDALKRRLVSVPESKLDTDGVLAKVHGREVVDAANCYLRLTEDRFPGIDSLELFRSHLEPAREAREKKLAHGAEVSKERKAYVALRDSVAHFDKLEETGQLTSDLQRRLHLEAVLELAAIHKTRHKNALKRKVAANEHRRAEMAELTQKLLPKWKKEVAEYDVGGAKAEELAAQLETAKSQLETAKKKRDEAVERAKSDAEWKADAGKAQTEVRGLRRLVAKAERRVAKLPAVVKKNKEMVRAKTTYALHTLPKELEAGEEAEAALTTKLKETKATITKSKRALAELADE